MLHSIRQGRCSSTEQEFLQKCDRLLPPTTKSQIKPTKLYAKNIDVANELVVSYSQHLLLLTSRGLCIIDIGRV